MIPLSKPNLGSREREVVYKAIDDGWISGTGSNISAFEAALCRVTGRRYAVAVANGTLALELALKVLPDGFEVIVPALTFAAPAAAVVNARRFALRFVDIDPLTWTLDIGETVAAINGLTAAVIAVDLLGHPFNASAIEPQHRLACVIEDAAEAHGARYTSAYYDNAPAGALGDISIFSFHANKAITTGEGGALLTDNPEIAQKARLLANHGMTSQRPYWHESAGTNYRMTNLTAAIGIGQVERWDELTRARQQVARAYDERLAPLFASGKLARRPVAVWAQESCWLYTVHSPQRQHYLNALRNADIDARAIWPALPDVPAFHAYSVDEQGYPVARKVAREAFWLPTWAGMPETVLDQICEVIHAAASKF